VQGGACAGRVLVLEHPGQAYRIGRSSGCHLTVADDDMSREHAEIERRWDGVFLRDLDSKNGVLLRGERLTGERRLVDGDVLLMGQTCFVFDDPEERLLRQMQEAQAYVMSAQPGASGLMAVDLADTRTSTRAEGLGLRINPARPPRLRARRDPVRPLTLLVIAAVILLGTIGLALSFLLAR